MSDIRGVKVKFLTEQVKCLYTQVNLQWADTFFSGEQVKFTGAQVYMSKKVYIYIYKT